MITIIELQSTLQKLKNRRVSYTEIGYALGTGRSNISKRVSEGSKIKDYELVKIEQYFNVDFGKQTTVNNSISKNNDIIQIPYIEWLPNEMKNPKYPDVVSRVMSIDDWGKIDSLRIVAMNGDSMECYWYRIQNKDVLLIDTSETKVNADGRGVYFATSRNNTKFWVREMMEQLDESIEFRAYPQSEIITKVYTKQQLKDVDFRIIGKVIKNVSLKLK